MTSYERWLSQCTEYRAHEELTHAEMKAAIDTYKQECIPATCPYGGICGDGWHYAPMPPALHDEYQRRWVVPMSERWRYEYHMTNAERAKLVDK